MIKDVYLPEDTRCLTTNGFKPLSDITSEDNLIVIDDNGELIYTNDFTIKSRDNVDSCRLFRRSNYYQCVADRYVEFLNKYNFCFRKDDEDIRSMYMNLDNDNHGPFKLDFIMALAIFVSSYFKKSGDNLISLNNRKAYFVLKNASAKNLFFRHDSELRQYNFKSSSLYLSTDKLISRLLENIDIFENILDKIIELDYAIPVKSKHYTYYFEVKNYNIAILLSSLISLCGHISFVSYISTNEMFRIKFKLNRHDIVSSKTTYNELIENKNQKKFYNISFKDDYSLIIFQNIKNISSMSIIKTSYNILETKEEIF